MSLFFFFFSPKSALFTIQSQGQSYLMSGVDKCKMGLWIVEVDFDRGRGRCVKGWAIAVTVIVAATRYP